MIRRFALIVAGLLCCATLAHAQPVFPIVPGSVWPSVVVFPASGVQSTGVVTGGALIVTQATAPTCSASCGTAPSVTGSDTAGVVTMGGTGVPASGFVITFNRTWGSAPSCIVQSALTSMVVGKLPIAVQTATTTITVTTNGTAPSNSDKYAYHCFGMQ